MIEIYKNIGKAMSTINSDIQMEILDIKYKDYYSIEECDGLEKI
jgi:hypothetical protein